MPQFRGTVAVDFDGTLCEFAFPECGSLKSGAYDALATFRRLGFKILIYSCRTSNESPDIFGYERGMYKRAAMEMQDYLEKHRLPYDEIYDGSYGKPIAEYYIDDKGIRFDDNWRDIEAFIVSRHEEIT